MTRAPAPVWLAACLAAAGCSGITAGTATPAGPAAAVSAEALPALLLPAAEVGAVLSGPQPGQQLVVTREVSALWQDGARLDDPACLAVAGAAQQEVYDGSGWTAVRAQVLREPPAAPSWSHFAVQAVVLFPTAADAADFFTASRDGWARCSDRELRYAQQPAPDQVWSIGATAVDQDVLAVSRVQHSPEQWACQRALTVHGNAAVDVEACSLDGAAPAATAIARAIAGRLPRA